jgi:hypothetical protein
MPKTSKKFPCTKRAEWDLHKQDTISSKVNISEK